MTPERLEQIRKRTEAATPGPWLGAYQEYGGYDCMTDAHSIGSRQTEVAVIDHALGTDAEADAEFIANARQDIPDLLAYIDEQRARADRLAAALEDVRARVHVQEHGGFIRGAVPAAQCDRWICEIVNRALTLGKGGRGGGEGGER